MDDRWFGLGDRCRYHAWAQLLETDTFSILDIRPSGRGCNDRDRRYSRCLDRELPATLLRQMVSNLLSTTWATQTVSRLCTCSWHYGNDCGLRILVSMPPFLLFASTVSLLCSSCLYRAFICGDANHDGSRLGEPSAFRRNLSSEIAIGCDLRIIVLSMRNFLLLYVRHQFVRGSLRVNRKLGA